MSRDVWYLNPMSVDRGWGQNPAAVYTRFYMQNVQQNNVVLAPDCVSFIANRNNAANR